MGLLAIKKGPIRFRALTLAVGCLLAGNTPTKRSTPTSLYYDNRIGCYTLVANGIPSTFTAIGTRQQAVIKTSKGHTVSSWADSYCTVRVYLNSYINSNFFAAAKLLLLSLFESNPDFVTGQPMRREC